MGLYKEVDHFFNEYYKKQEQIYDDTCDVGISVTGIDDPLCKTLKEIFSNTGKWKGFMPGIKKHRSEERFSNGTLMYSEVTVYLPWEQEKDTIRCTEWKINYCNDPNRRKHFITFQATQAFCQENQVWE